MSAYFNGAQDKAFVVEFGGGAAFLDLPRPPKPMPRGGKRGKVNKFSSEARGRMAWTCAALQHHFLYMTTLTLHTSVNMTGKGFKKALHGWLAKVRRQGRPHFWWLEFTKKGMAHVHVFTGGEDYQGYVSNMGGTDVFLWESNQESARWTGLVERHCMSVDLPEVHGEFRVGDGPFDRMRRASVRVERIRVTGGAARYSAKYACKSYQKETPEGFDPGRFWGFGGCSLEVVGTRTVGADCAAIASRFKTPDGAEYNRSRWLSVKDLDFRLQTSGAETLGGIPRENLAFILAKLDCHGPEDVAHVVSSEEGNHDGF